MSISKAKYWFDCTSIPKKLIGEFDMAMDDARETTYEAFRKRVDTEDLNAIARKLGYYIGKKRGEMKLSDDGYIQYMSTKFRGKPIWIMKHSSIEYVFSTQQIK